MQNDVVLEVFYFRQILVNGFAIAGAIARQAYELIGPDRCAGPGVELVGELIETDFHREIVLLGQEGLTFRLRLIRMAMRAMTTMISTRVKAWRSGRFNWARDAAFMNLVFM
jgi:hypothetical protein